MKNFYDKFRSGRDKYTLSHNNLFKVMFQTDLGQIFGNSSSIDTANDIDIVMQSIDLPNMVVGSGEDLSINTDYVTFNAPANSIIKPESQDFTITILNTLQNPIENIFLPWMNHSTSAKQQFIRSTLNVIIYKNEILDDFSESDVKYIYEISGVYPVHIDTPNLSHSEPNILRTVGFKFNTIKLKYSHLQLG